MTLPPIARVGVSAGKKLNASVISACVQLKNNGIIPVILEHDPALIEQQLATLDGVLMMGNPWDIPPKDYNASIDPHTNIPSEDTVEYELYARRMAYEKELAPQVIAKKLPLLGICGGMQRINISGDENHPELHPGTLQQHVNDAMEGVSHQNAFDTAAPFTPIHFIKIADDTCLKTISKGHTGYFNPMESLFPEGIFAENSLHHQAVDKLREGFRVSAVSSDGTIEGIEPDPKGPYAKQFIQGIQFHPEFSASSLGANIMSAFANVTKEHAAARPKQGTAEELDNFFVSPAMNDVLKGGKPAIEALFDPVHAGYVEKQNLVENFR